MSVQNCMFPITMFIDSLQPHPTSLVNSESPISMTNLSVQTRLGEGGSRGFSMNTRQMLSPYPILSCDPGWPHNSYDRCILFSD